jgi:hypothetical protein
MQASRQRRPTSIAAVLTSWFSAALDARYAYQPPRWLSDIEPTRADSAATTAFPVRGSSGAKCFSTRAGPVALMANTRASRAGSSSCRDFSGRRSSPWSTPVATITSRGGRGRQASAAAAIEASSSRSCDERHDPGRRPIRRPARHGRDGGHGRVHRQRLDERTADAARRAEDDRVERRREARERGVIGNHGGISRRRGRPIQARMRLTRRPAAPRAAPRRRRGAIRGGRR